MKKFFYTLVIVIFSSGFCFADDVIHLAITEPADIIQEQQIEINDDKNIEKPIILENEPIKAEVEFNALNETKSLLSDYTSLHFDKGPIETFNPYFVYQGNFNFNFLQDEYHTEYQNQLVDLNINGKFRNAPISYTLQYNFLSKKGHNYLQTFFKDNYLKFSYIPHHDIYVGQFKVPVGIEGCAGNYTMPFINQSQIARAYGQVRAIGAKVTGDYKYVDYTFSVTSSDRFFHQFFPGAEFTGWINAKPLAFANGKYGSLKIGGGVNLGHRNYAYKVISAGLDYKYKRFGLVAEYGYADGSNGLTGFTKNRSQGAVVTASYYLTKKLQVLARYDIFNSNLAEKDKLISEYTAGINYFIKGSAAKIILNYTLRHLQTGENSHRFLVGTQLII